MRGAGFRNLALPAHLRALPLHDDLLGATALFTMTLTSLSRDTMLLSTFYANGNFYNQCKITCRNSHTY
ncbi:hypothetical protein FA041_05280 [Escherichia coli]|nr:hypothetical protein [Escherichia coli]